VPAAILPADLPARLQPGAGPLAFATTIGTRRVEFRPVVASHHHDAVCSTIVRGAPRVRRLSCLGQIVHARNVPARRSLDLFLSEWRGKGQVRGTHSATGANSDASAITDWFHHWRALRLAGPGVDPAPVLPLTEVAPKRPSGPTERW
jgi:hypothetical protein